MIRDQQSMDDLLRRTRAFVRDVAIPNERRVEQLDEVPEDLVSAMRQAGFFGWSIPQTYGGAGLTTEELALANIELSQCSVAFRARCGTNTGIGTEALVVDGTEDQKQRYLPRLASGEITSCLAVTEPDAGSDLLGGLQTVAVADGDSYVLNGVKRYITNAPIADLFTVLARTEPGARGASGTTCFLIERGTPGLSTGAPHRKMGQAGSPVSEVYLRDCRVPKDSVLGGKAGQGFRSVMKALNKQRINLAALCTGPAIRMLDEAIVHARKRRQFGQPIGEFQLVQAMLADCKVEIEAARALILETARKRDRGEDVTLDVSMCKLYASEMCGRVADRVVQIFGGAGYCGDIADPIERLYRDVRLFRLYEGTSQIHQLNIAKLLLRDTTD
ncbi:MAG TPA: acyl-CoA dehydrogenase family protein [Burkholderiaceae bacterium]|jgi:acyl-CoA dehydrogenase|nr:acyl-CoA dehydrogenase family protein [Burkholderiaceae bacterium]